ncbi:MAG: metal-dependent hydrolase [Firmicutes bacterium ADurb.Bin182]|nr:MAG: metal-dependent hydrolase [Firmicutes bacterium ADurb.Bin182]
MTLKWFGHSCFLLTDSRGVRILTDPFDPETGYNLEKTEAEIVTCSHNHHDHHYVEAAAGNPKIIDKPGEYEVNGVRIKGVKTFHDDAKGVKRGENTVFIFDVDGMRIAHFGDIGEIPDESTLNEIGDIDVMLVPIGGNYTIGHTEALQLANLVKTNVLIPMHYSTPDVKFKLGPLAPMLREAKNCKIHKLNQPEATLTRESLGEDRLLVLTYK